MTLPFRIHTWLGTFELDDGAARRPTRGVDGSGLALLLRELAEDGLGVHRLIELAPELGRHDPAEDVAAFVDLAVAAVQDGRISVREIDHLQARTPVDTSTVDLADLAAPEPAREQPPASQASRTTRFEVQLVDELGEPVPDIALVLSEDGGSRTITTDGDGMARIEDATASFGAVRIGSVPALREPLHERWRTIRLGDWLEPAPERTVLQLREEMPSVSLRADTPHVISVQPRVVLARLVGMFFATDKTFLLPSGLATIRAVKQLYDENPRATVLAVGHTDTTAQAEHNLVLSTDRADALVAYLSDRVEVWLDWYGSHRLASQRWGRAEDLLMIGAMPDAATRDPSEDPVRFYQRTRGLEVDGVAGPKTREALVGEYMAFDGTTLPANTKAEIHGCGENFPAQATGDEQDVAENRRVELFLFESEIMPPPPGPHSSADAPEYPEWQRRARETHEFRPGEHVLAPLVVAWSRAIIEALPADTLLSLEGEGIPRKDLPIGEGETSGGVVSFAFEDASGSRPCTLTARARDREIVLWRDEIVDRLEPPLRWLADLADLIEPSDDDGDATDEVAVGDFEPDDMLVGDPPVFSQAVA
jgi:outer membrane protein OmpA-like peptidoglycan-associated protein